MEQNSEPLQPDMALNTASDGRLDDASRFAASDPDTETLLLGQNNNPRKIFDGTGPPFTSFYLTNLTFRC